MIKSIEERKKEYLEYIKEEYRTKPRRCWQTAKPKYIPMDEFGKKSRQYYPDSAETLIKYDIKGALFSSALFFALLMGIFIWNYFSEKKFDFGSVLFVLLFLIYSVVQIYKNMRQPVRIRMNDYGIWLHTVNEWIEWSKIVDTYIKIDTSDETTVYFLLIHFYSKEMDRFMYTEYEYVSLDRKLKDVAAEIVSRIELQ